MESKKSLHLSFEEGPKEESEKQNKSLAVNASKQETSLEQQKELKQFIDNEISQKVRSVVKQQVLKMFSEYVGKKEKGDLEHEQQIE